MLCSSAARPVSHLCQHLAFSANLTPCCPLHVQELPTPGGQQHGFFPPRPPTTPLTPDGAPRSNGHSARLHDPQLPSSDGPIVRSMRRASMATSSAPRMQRPTTSAGPGGDSSGSVVQSQSVVRFFLLSRCARSHTCACASPVYAVANDLSLDS